MHRIRKEEGQKTKKNQVYFPSFSHEVFVLYSLREVFSTHIAIYLFNFSIPLLFCVFSYLWKEIFHEGKAVYVGIFLMLFLPHTKLIFPCMQGNFSYVIFLFHTKLIFPCMQGELNKSHTRNIFVGYM
jgi:hypothetical protein